MVSLTPVAVPVLAAALLTSAAAVAVVLPNGPARPESPAPAAAPGRRADVAGDGRTPSGAAAAVVTPGPAAAAPRLPSLPGSLRLTPVARTGRPNDPAAPPGLNPPPARVGSTGSSVAAWRWPLDPVPTVVRRFQVGPLRWTPGHRGVDLATRLGAQVLSPAPGVVSYADTLAGRGVMVVAFANGLRTTFEPVWPIARPGARVGSGEVLGIVEAGSAHCGVTTCLHWGVLSGTRYLDPLRMLAPPRPAVLLPLQR